MQDVVRVGVVNGLVVPAVVKNTAFFESLPCLLILEEVCS
jgi:hypothetical protein